MTFICPLGVSVIVPPSMVSVAFDFMLLLISPEFLMVMVPALIVRLPSAFSPMALYDVPSSSLASLEPA